ncbi:eukaryotic translation initiation factor 3 subunit A [Coemansia sp. RSA 2049]|nr:eukaryotic translation initiation factor 3 subunit A [Coemansia sp. RSA 2049]
MTAMGLKRNLLNKSEALSDSFTEAYNKTLMQFHNFIVKKMFGVAMLACPNRETFYEKIGGNNDKVHEGLLAWVDALQNILNQLNIFYASGAYDKGL